jgi:NAD(P)-dependent dehydrogenase (short-subunit alcohol dehydrogenase family)
VQRDDTYHRLFDLTGRVALVTGGTGILGSRYIAALAEYGARVVIADLDAAKCEAAAARLAASYGAGALGVGVDVSDARSVAAMTDRVETTLGPIEVLVNNAASKSADLGAFFAATESYSLDTWRQIMSVNLDGLFLVAQAVGARMCERRRGSIINVSSIYGSVGADQRIYEGSEYLGRPINTPAVYSASKAGVVGLTRHLAAQWGAHNVRVNTLTPGGVESGQNDTFKSRYGARSPLGRMARADEMVGAVIFLASDASSYVTGHNLHVDGGWSAW